MPNGKFSHSRGGDRPNPFHTTDNEETTALPMDSLEAFLHEDSMEDLSEMELPDADLHDFSREDLPPLTEGEYLLDPDLEHEQPPQPPTEEEAIENAFNAAVEKEDRLPPFVEHIQSLWKSHKKTVLVSGCAVALVADSGHCRLLPVCEALRSL